MKRTHFLSCIIFFSLFFIGCSTVDKKTELWSKLMVNSVITDYGEIAIGSLCTDAIENEIKDVL